MPIQRKYDFQPGRKISSSQVDEEFNQLISQINQIESDDKAKDTDLRKKVQMAKITADDGGVSVFANKTTDDILQLILSKGTGMHTFYASGGAKNLPPSGISVRGVAQLTSPNFGWVWCIDYKNQMWTNYLDNNVWTGWKKLLSGDSKVLWTGAAYPLATNTILPSKKLSECTIGWILVWSDYDYGSGSNDDHWVHTPIHKTQMSLDGASDMLFQIPSSDSKKNESTNKALSVYDDKIVGFDSNAGAENYARDVVLRAVIEF